MSVSNVTWVSTEASRVYSGNYYADFENSLTLYDKDGNVKQVLLSKGNNNNVAEKRMMVVGVLPTDYVVFNAYSKPSVYTPYDGYARGFCGRCEVSADLIYLSE